MSQIQTIIGCSVQLAEFASIEANTPGLYQIRVRFSTSLNPLIRVKLNRICPEECTDAQSDEHSKKDRKVNYAFALSNDDNSSSNSSTTAYSQLYSSSMKKYDYKYSRDAFKFELTTSISPQRIIKDFKDLGLALHLELWFLDDRNIQ
ncbi:hypothetical protein GJ496_011417 [Pomphorhynchus laevis]|nr:hypothetical protein GJ496_011417 [Pomphorhynchus laevis]